MLDNNIEEADVSADLLLLLLIRGLDTDWLDNLKEKP